MSQFKKCPNGHRYPATEPKCPYCKPGQSQFNPYVSSSQPTQVISSLDGEPGLHTTIDDEPIAATSASNLDPHQDFSKTMVEEEVIYKDQSGNETKGMEKRIASMLVGWLVTYDLDDNGVDFRLYEGRNIIGRDPSCTVCINDNKVSAQHAILLYRNGKFRIKDNLSVNGTIVNGKDIDDDSVLLMDGDNIVIGNIQLLFRTSKLQESTDQDNLQ